MAGYTEITYFLRNVLAVEQQIKKKKRKFSVRDGQNCLGGPSICVAKNS